jgi:hypothetical protein
VLEHKTDVLFLSAEDGVELDDVGVRKLGEMLDFANCIRGNTVFVLDV